MSLGKIFHKLYIQTEDYKREVIRKTINKYSPFNKFLDVGCWDGISTLDAISGSQIIGVYGIEPIEEKSKEAKGRKIITKSFLVDKDPWDYEDNFFDCINNSEVIEHLSDIDFFLEQASKKLKRGGYLITTTNNLSSLHNLASLFFGWAPFDLTNSSKKIWSIGNPFSIHNNEELTDRGASWTHKCIYTPYWLTKWMELYGFEFVEYRGIGFYPLHPKFGSIFKKHSALFTLVVRKK